MPEAAKQAAPGTQKANQSQVVLERKTCVFCVSLASIMSSTLRSRDLLDEVMRMTEGKGLDVVPQFAAR